MRFRILKFKPRAVAAATPPRRGRADARRARAGVRARAARTTTPSSGRASRQRELRIQRCTACKTAPPSAGPDVPALPLARLGLRIVASGRGRVFSYVVAHHPPVPPFEYPNPIVLVELEEGTRLVSNLVGVGPRASRIGMPVQVEFTRGRARSSCCRCSGPRPRGTSMDFSLSEDPGSDPRSRAQDLRGPRAPRAPARARAQRRVVRRRAVVRARLRAGCSSRRDPRARAAAAGSASSSCAWCSRSRAATWRRCRCFATALLGALPIARVRHAGAAGSLAAPGRGRGRACSRAALVELGGSDPAAPRTHGAPRRRRLAPRRREGVRAGGGPRRARSWCRRARRRACACCCARSAARRASTLERQVATSREPQSRLTLDGARVGADAVLGAPERGRGDRRAGWRSARCSGSLRSSSASSQAALRDTAALHRAAQAVRPPDRDVPGRRAARRRRLDRRRGDARGGAPGGLAGVPPGATPAAAIAAAKWWAADGRAARRAHRAAPARRHRLGHRVPGAPLLPVVEAERAAARRRARSRRRGSGKRSRRRRAEARALAHGRRCATTR